MPIIMNSKDLDMGAWRARIARDDNGKLHFVYARYDKIDPRQRCGLLALSGGPFLQGSNIEQMRNAARALLRACEEPFISFKEHEYEPDDDRDRDEE